MSNIQGVNIGEAVQENKFTSFDIQKVEVDTYPQIMKSNGSPDRLSPEKQIENQDILQNTRPSKSFEPMLESDPFKVQR